MIESLAEIFLRYFSSFSLHFFARYRHFSRFGFTPPDIFISQIAAEADIFFRWRFRDDAFITPARRLRHHVTDGRADAAMPCHAAIERRL
jgi:hypothetical protein